MTPFHLFGNGSSQPSEQSIAPTPANIPERFTSSADILFFSTPWCGDCRRSRRVFSALDVPFTEIDIEEDSDATTFVMRLNRGMRSVPTILFPDGSVLVEPSSSELEAKLKQITAA
jgi:mycoredoxin